MQRLGAHLDQARFRYVEADFRAFAAGARHHVLQQTGEVERNRPFLAVAPGERQVVGDHHLHIGDVGLQLVDVGAVAEHRQLQLHARQGGAQVMADAGQHIGTLGDLALDAVAHDQEGPGRLAHLAGALRLEVRRVVAFAEAVRRGGEAPDRPDLVAHEQQGDGKKHDAGPDHPYDEQDAGDAEQAVARHQDGHHAVRQFELDFDPPVENLRHDAERDVDLIAQRPVHFGLQNPVAADRAARPDRLAGVEGDRQADMLGRHVEKRRPLRRRIELVELVDDHGQFTGDGERQPARHRLPVLLVEIEHGDELHQRHRRDDDHQRTAEQGARQETLYAEAPPDAAGELVAGPVGPARRLVLADPIAVGNRFAVHHRPSGLST